jgi:hypothetical protein
VEYFRVLEEVPDPPTRNGNDDDQGRNRGCNGRNRNGRRGRDRNDNNQGNGGDRPNKKQRNNNNSNNNNSRGDNHGKNQRKEQHDPDAPCPYHRGTHLWQDCFDNAWGANPGNSKGIGRNNCRNNGNVNQNRLSGNSGGSNGNGRNSGSKTQFAGATHFNTQQDRPIKEEPDDGKTHMSDICVDTMAQLDEFLTSTACSSIGQNKADTKTCESYCATLEECFTSGDNMHENTISAICKTISKPNTRPIALMHVRWIAQCDATQKTFCALFDTGSDVTILNSKVLLKEVQPTPINTRL